MAKNPLKSTGFSLIEMMAVLFIFMILVIIGLPFLRQYSPTLKLKGEAKDLASELRYAQQLTLTQQTTHLARFFPAENKYQIIKAPAGQDEQIIKEIFLQTPITFETITFTGNQVSFNASGTSSEAGQIILTNQENNIIVEVKPSGYIKVIE